MAKARGKMSRDQVRDIIRSVGFRATPGRIAVYTRLLHAQAPMTHADLVQAVDELGLDPATVYRNLIDLSDAGLISRSDLGDHVWRFEVMPEGQETRSHPHFVCIDCGTVSCLDDVEVNFSRAKRAPRALGKKEVEVQIRGLCDQCA